MLTHLKESLAIATANRLAEFEVLHAELSGTQREIEIRSTTWAGQ